MDNQGVDPSASPLGCNDPTNHVTDYVLFIGDSAVVVSSSSFVSSQLGVVYLEGSVVSLVSNVFAPVSTVVYPAYPTFAKNIYSSNTDLAYVDEEYEMKDFFLVIIKIYLCLYYSCRSLHNYFIFINDPTKSHTTIINGLQTIPTSFIPVLSKISVVCYEYLYFINVVIIILGTCWRNVEHCV
jgi:hypothetical protein